MPDQKAVLSPDRIGSVTELRPQASSAVKLTPETKVLCLHRGRNARQDGCLIRQRDGKLETELYTDPETGAKSERHPRTAYIGDYLDQFDSHHFIIAAGAYFTTEYGAALHFKSRAVVPGSRNPETGFQASFIAIIGVAVPTLEGLRIEQPIDDEVEWDPFSDEECGEYGMAVEALDRANMLDPIDAEVTIVPTRGARNEAAVTQSRVKSGAQGRSKRKTEISGPGAAALKSRNAPAENDAIREARATAAEIEKGELTKADA